MWSQEKSTAVDKLGAVCTVTQYSPYTEKQDSCKSSHISITAHPKHYSTKQQKHLMNNSFVCIVMAAEALGKHMNGASVITVRSIPPEGSGIDRSRRRGAILLLPRGHSVHGREIEISLRHAGTH